MWSTRLGYTLCSRSSDQEWYGQGSRQRNMLRAWIEDQSIFPSTCLTVGISQLSSTSRKALFKSAMKSMESADDAAWWSSAAKRCVAHNLSPHIPPDWLQMREVDSRSYLHLLHGWRGTSHMWCAWHFAYRSSFVDLPLSESLRATQRNFRRCALKRLGFGQADVSPLNICIFLTGD